MAISREKKDSIVADYRKLIKGSQAIIISKYGGMTMPQLDKVRVQVRSSKAEFHVTKNTLLLHVLKEAGYDVPEQWLVGQTGVSFCFADPAATAKAVSELAKENDKFKTIGGVLSGRAMDAQGVAALASLPSLDVLRAQIVGTIVAPATGLVSVLNSAIGGVMFALQAKIDKEQPQAAA